MSEFLLYLPADTSTRLEAEEEFDIGEPLTPAENRLVVIVLAITAMPWVVGVAALVRHALS